jgi:hypothetical protein
VVAERGERVSVSKGATQKFYMQRFYLEKLNDEQVKIMRPNHKQVCSFGRLE